MTDTIQSPATMANDSSFGENDWANPTNVDSSDDNRATVTNQPGGDPGDESVYLKCTGFGFSIPVGATILGVEVLYERSATGSGDTEDNSIRLVIADSVSGDDKAASGVWSGTDEIITRGGASDTWGLTITVAQVNATNFGCSISCKETEGKSDSDTGRIDHIQMRITFSTPAGTFLSQSTIIM